MPEATDRTIGRRTRRIASAVVGLVTIVVLAIGATRTDSSSGQDGSADDAAATAAHDHGDSTSTSSRPVAAGPGVNPRAASEAEVIVKAFVEHIRHDGVEEAAQFWSGYPDLVDAPPAEVARALEGLTQRYPWLAGPTHYEVVVTRAADATHPVVVVTVAPVAGEAVAFVVGEPLAGQAPSHGHVVIHRLPEPAPTPTPAPGSPVRPGDDIVVPGRPVTGTVAHAGATEVPAVEHPAADPTGVALTVPDDAGDPLVLTVSHPSPELPTATAYTYPHTPT